MHPDGFPGCMSKYLRPAPEMWLVVFLQTEK
jgi:hypothetical protein